MNPAAENIFDKSFIGRFSPPPPSLSRKDQCLIICSRVVDHQPIDTDRPSIQSPLIPRRAVVAANFTSRRFLSKLLTSSSYRAAVAWCLRGCVTVSAMGQGASTCWTTAVAALLAVASVPGVAVVTVCWPLDNNNNNSNNTLLLFSNSASIYTCTTVQDTEDKWETEAKNTCNNYYFLKFLTFYLQNNNIILSSRAERRHQPCFSPNSS